MKTSEQAYEEYQKLRVVEDNLRRENKGLNLLNSKKSKPTLSIHLYKKVEGNLLTMTSEIVVNSNLPFMSWNFQDVSVEDFFKRFEEYVESPVFKRFIKLNRKQENQLSCWGLTNFREDIIDVKDIDISFGEECLKEMGKDFVKNFNHEIKRVLNKQHIATESESKDFTRYFILCEEIQDLKRQAKTSSHYYSYDRSKDKSLAISITDEEHDKKLKLIEKELKVLKKTHKFLAIPRLDYKVQDDDDENMTDYEECEEFDDDGEEMY